MFARPRFARSVLIVLAISALAANHADADNALDGKLKSASQEFAQKKAAAKAKALKEFDLRIMRTKSGPSTTAAARAEKRNELTAARKVFEGSERFPTDDEYADIELRYYLAVNKAFLPLSKLINQTIDQGIRTNNKQLEESGLKLKANLESQIAGAEKLTFRSFWQGTFQRGGATIPYHLRITKRGDNSFKGHVEDNPGVAGNWAYDVEGQTSGLAVQFVMTRSVRGKFRAVTVNGIVSGDRLIGQVTQAVGKGKPTAGLIVLRRN
jgi:hypothetical protein